MIAGMETFTKEQVVGVLRSRVESTTCSRAAAELGVSPALVSLVLSGGRDLSADLALRLGFIRTPDTYMRAPNKKANR